MPENHKATAREEAISSISADCLREGKAGIVAGHYMFWPEEDAKGASVWTQSDLEIYTHILYLDTPAELIRERSSNDPARNRTISSINHLQHWQVAEKAELRTICQQEHIMFLVLDYKQATVPNVSEVLQKFRLYSRARNLRSAQDRVNALVSAPGTLVPSMVVLDGDKTLAPVDTGSLFWQNINMQRGLERESDPLTSPFSSALGYSHTAFRQATLMYEEVDETTFENACTEVAAAVTLYPDIAWLLRLIRDEKHAGAVLVTCGLRVIWEKILEMEGLTDKVRVLGNGRLNENLVVDAQVKAEVVSHMRQVHRLFVTVFGDSTLDLPMLGRANHAVIVVGNEHGRSKSMDASLAQWIKQKGLHARQAVLDPEAAPRLDEKKLPLVRLRDPSFIDVIFPHRHDHVDLQFDHLTNTNATKLLMTPMRDSSNAGPSLREAHHKAGWYLATNIIAEALGVEEYQTPHVRGGQTPGYRLLGEQKTLIVAVMRGGESMAFGISEAFPQAPFLHAAEPYHVTGEYLADMLAVILVDSVVNNGQTMIDFVHQVHNLAPNVRLIMVAGVLQSAAVAKLESLQETIRHCNISLVALRKSDNKYTGTGTSDTGNRLFNAVQLQ